jgi:glycosyltransferase involved in cell wall biosynthesis
MKPLKIVIISGTILPYNVPRSQRATELAKYFARIGHDVTLYAVLGSYDYTKFIEETGVRVKSFDKMLFVKENSDEEEAKRNIIIKVLTRLFYRIFEFPNIEFVWKVPKLIRKESNIDLLITVTMPHPINWGAAIAKKKLKDRFPRVWISDCGDPYMGNSVGKKPPFYFQYIENFWGNQTDYVTIPIEEAKIAYSKKVQNKLKVIPQGFDFSVLDSIESFKGNSVTHFAYAGTVYSAYRDPTEFLEYLSTIKQDFRFIVYTKTKEIFERFLPKLKEKLIIRDYVPRDELLKVLSSMDFLVNINNKSSVQSPSKLIDYYLSKRPILNISTSFEEQREFEEFMTGEFQSQMVVENI